MKKYLLLQVVFALLFTGCVMTELKPSSLNGKVYKDAIQLQGLNIPLPEGEWHVIGSGEVSHPIIGGFRTGQNNEFHVVLLKKSELGKALGLLFISTDLPGNDIKGFLSQRHFERTDLLYKVVKNNDLYGAQDGWSINPVIMPRIRQNISPNKEAFNYLRSNNIEVPNVMISTYHRFTGKYIKTKVLNYSHHINPETDGFDSWSTSDWNVFEINKDHKRVEYIEKAKINGAVFHQKLRAAFGD